MIIGSTSSTFPSFLRYLAQLRQVGCRRLRRRRHRRRPRRWHVGRGAAAGLHAELSPPRAYQALTGRSGRVQLENVEQRDDVGNDAARGV